MPSVIPNPKAAGIDTSMSPEERYEIIGRIASGGMAEIYLSRMFSSNGAAREVVLKRLMPELQSDQEFVQMFYDEANIAARLRHPNIVHIFELGELDGSLFIAMELLRGVNLRDLLARLHARGEELPVPIAVRIACQALEALDYAHRFSDQAGRRLNVVHRDVSPQNIIVTFEGATKLVDFGVAKAEGRLHQTRAGLIKGKFAYMAPEQVSGGNVDGRSDIFALAEVFYELLLKRHPFYAASDMEVLRAILDKDPPHPCSLDGRFPSALGEVLMRAMKKAPGDRYATAAAMQDDLERFLQEARTPASTAMVARYVGEVFADRIEAERTARQRGDEAALVEAMTAGRADHAAAPPPRAPRVVSDTGRDSSSRAMVVRGSGPTEPEESRTPTFMAHSGHTDPAISQRRFGAQVAELFDDPAETGGAGAGSPVSPGDLGDDEDEDDMPTMLGTLSADQLAEIRGAKARVKSGPAVSGGGRVGGGVSVTPVDPATMPQRGLVTPVKEQAPRTAPRAPQPPVTPRSETIIPDDAAFAAPKSDKLGLLFFVAGLGALVGAVIYAFWLYSASQTLVTELDLKSVPTGAAIILDGTDTGAKTPQLFRNIPADKTHVVEFRLHGHEPCRAEIKPSTNGKEDISCTLRKLD